MKKIGLLFPGQGSQYVGMCKDFFEGDGKAALSNAGIILGFDIEKVITEGPEDLLKQTQYTQPAIFAASVIAFRSFLANLGNKTFDFICAGHSLGEYSAFCASGAFSFEDGIKLVKKRGELIFHASEKNPGSMAAIIGLDKEKVFELCKKAGGVCEPVNFNCPGQIVIAGTADAVKNAADNAVSFGAERAIMLNVSGPFHSSLMKDAAEGMKIELEKFAFNKPGFPVVTNCDALPTVSSDEISGKLYKQINNAVLWDDTLNRMIRSGVEIFIEIGPKRVLSGMVRRIDKTKKLYNVEDNVSMQKTLKEITL